MDPSTHPLTPDSNPRFDRNLTDCFVQEATAAAHRIHRNLQTRLLDSEYRLIGPQFKRAPLQCGEDPKLYEEHRFQADLRDGSRLVLEVASAYTCPDRSVIQPIRFYRQTNDEKHGFTQGRLIEWFDFAERFYDHYCQSKERRKFFRRGS